MSTATPSDVSLEFALATKNRENDINFSEDEDDINDEMALNTLEVQNTSNSWKSDL